MRPLSPLAPVAVQGRLGRPGYQSQNPPAMERRKPNWDEARNYMDAAVLSFRIDEEEKLAGLFDEVSGHFTKNSLNSFESSLGQRSVEVRDVKAVARVARADSAAECTPDEANDYMDAAVLSFRIDEEEKLAGLFDEVSGHFTQNFLDSFESSLGQRSVEVRDVKAVARDGRAVSAEYDCFVAAVRGA